MPTQVPHSNSTVKNVLQIMNAEPSSAPNNNSQQHLMNDETAGGRSPITGKQKITVVILCFVNLINYMDRYTIAGNENYQLALSTLLLKRRKFDDGNYRDNYPLLFYDNIFASPIVVFFLAVSYEI